LLLIELAELVADSLLFWLIELAELVADSLLFWQSLHDGLARRALVYGHSPRAAEVHRYVAAEVHRYVAAEVHRYVGHRYVSVPGPLAPTHCME